MASEDPDPSHLAAIRQAVTGVAVARERLAAAVRGARTAGRTWAEIGHTLGTSRQAAFKRFGAPRDPRTGEAMAPTSTGDVAALTERIFTLIDAGRYEYVHALMTDDVAAVLTREVVLDTWAGVVAETGTLLRCANTHVELPTGEEIADDRAVLGVIIGVTTLECEAGSWTGRVALDAQRRLLGLLVVPPGTSGLPF